MLQPRSSTAVPMTFVPLVDAMKSVTHVITLVATLSLAAPSAFAAQEAVYETSVAAQPDEDVASDCRYELTLPDSAQTIRATWVSSSAVVISSKSTGMPRFERSLGATTWHCYTPSTARRRRI